jgi:hypothetical protein
VLAVLLGLLVLVPAAGSSTTPFIVGFADIAPGEAGSAVVTPAAGLGASAFRFTLQWAPGQTVLSSGQAATLHAGVSAASTMRIVLSVYGTTSTAPADAAARTAYCAFVADALRLEPSIEDVVIWNEPNKDQFWHPVSPAAYEALLAACDDALPASINIIGFALSHNGNDDAQGASPGAFIRAVGTAYRASGRSSRIFDTVAFHPYPATSLERPWAKHVGSAMIGEGDWNKLMYNLWLAFDGTGQDLPGQGGVSIWYTELGFQTAVPAAKASLYSGSENVATLPEDVGGDTEPHPAATSPAPDQATQIEDAVALATCQPYVGAIFNFLIADESVLPGWQSGLLYPDFTKKTSYAAVAPTLARAAAGSVDCSALKGGAPSADFLPPSAPSSLTAASVAGPLGVSLSWAGSTDDQSAISYRIYRGSTQVATSTATSWTDTAVGEGGTYSYTVRAIDAASNLGAASNGAAVTVPVPVATPPPSPPPSPTPPPPVPSPSAPPPVVPAPAAPPTPPAPTSVTKQPQLVHVVTGTARRDVLRGSSRDDVLRGLGGDDTLYGLRGADVLLGGTGRDRLLAGLGNDTVYARDGRRDTVDCGSGRDVVEADRFDVVAKNCERVLRPRRA